MMKDLIHVVWIKDYHKLISSKDSFECFCNEYNLEYDYINHIIWLSLFKSRPTIIVMFDDAKIRDSETRIIRQRLLDFEFYKFRFLSMGRMRCETDLCNIHFILRKSWVRAALLGLNINALFYYNTDRLINERWDDDFSRYIQPTISSRNECYVNTKIFLSS